MIPSEGQVSLETAAKLIASAPSVLGISDASEVRSVLVHVNGRWFNHCTVFRVGTGRSTLTEPVDIVAGPVRLVAATFSAETITSAEILRDALSTWGIALPADVIRMLNEHRFGPGVVPKPWDFQETANINHHASRTPWGEYPCWVIDVYDKISENRSLAGPRGPFKNFDENFYAENLGAAVQQWVEDPFGRDSSAVQDSYRIVLPDHRGVVRDLQRRSNELVVTVEQSRPNTLTCGLTVRDHRGVQSRLQAPVKAGHAALALPPLTRSVELYLFDESESWCDSYTESEGYRSWGRAIAVMSDGDPSEVERAETEFSSTALPLMDLLLPPRYAGPRQSLAKALEYSTGTKPDLPNAAKEAICAVEGMARVVTGLRTATLGAILKHLKKAGGLDPSIAKSLEALWGYASNSPGVRHGGITAATISEDEARLVVDMSAAAVRYLLALDAGDTS
ncbi:MAG TPA: hypothetical protein VEK77_08510 [Gemmatimonadales bacterium]|nr:hypothetical protein [Gemmatimonadales bacterium]